MSGTYQQNKGRYALRMAEEQSQATSHTVQPVRFRSPRHFTPAERAAHNEIMSTCTGLTEADRLLVEITAQLLARQRAGTTRTSETNKLVGLLERLRSRTVTPAPAKAVKPSGPNNLEEDEEDRALRELDELDE